jgi:hypothetical protein
MIKDVILGKIMQKKCDLYLCDSVRSERLRFIQLYDKNFSYDDEKTYMGYLGVDVDRIKLVSVISDFRMHKINCFSVPIEYRDRKNISAKHALSLANDYAKNLGASAFGPVMSESRCSPVFWIFALKYDSTAEEKAGGVVMIDRLDGHVWTDTESEEYMYDYNNLF